MLSTETRTFGSYEECIVTVIGLDREGYLLWKMNCVVGEESPNMVGMSLCTDGWREYAYDDQRVYLTYEAGSTLLEYLGG